MQRSYNKLLGRIVEIFGTRGAFGKSMGWSDRTTSLKLNGKVDWKQDESIIFSAINKSAGFETRLAEYIHWWTFLGYFSEIGDGLFSQVVNIRTKKAKGKKLGKWEREFYNEHRELIDIKQHYNSEEQAEIDRLKAIL